MHKITKLQNWLLEIIAKKLVIQSSSHQFNMTKYYNILYMAAFSEFTEDNDPTLKSLMLELCIDSLGIDKEYAIMLLTNIDKRT